MNAPAQPIARTLIPVACLAAALSAGASAGAPELGVIDWGRDLNTALAESERSGRPALVLFDEVPGCETCISYGRDVLSHPLIVEAAESLFVPVAVFNNIDGADREILLSFGEPTWNNPDVRIIDHDRNPLADRLADDYTVGGLARAM